MNRVLSTILIFWIIWAGVFVVFYYFEKPEALALQGNYTTKTIGDGITATEWNYLDEDFLMKEGDVMMGDLTMRGNCITGLADLVATNLNSLATVAYVSALSGQGANDRTGASLSIVCGSTVQGASGWVAHTFPNYSYVDVDTRNGSISNFLSTPYYFASIGGAGNMFRYGNIAIYNPTQDGFRAQIPRSIAVNSLENIYQWYINWCGVGN